MFAVVHLRAVEIELSPSLDAPPKVQAVFANVVPLRPAAEGTRWEVNSIVEMVALQSGVASTAPPVPDAVVFPNALLVLARGRNLMVPV